MVDADGDFAPVEFSAVARVAGLHRPDSQRGAALVTNLIDVAELDFQDATQEHLACRAATGLQHLFGCQDGNIHEAIEALRTPPLGGLIHTNEYVYDLLTLGKRLVQEIESDRKSHPLRYIDVVNIALRPFPVDVA